MQDYMKALQKQFDRQEFDDLRALVEYTHEELKRSMDIAERRKLLLLDAQNTLLARSTLMSFTAGFKQAAGIAGELGAPYSFDADEEEKAKEMITNGKETCQRRGQHPQTRRRALGGALHRRLPPQNRKAHHQKRAG